MEIHKYENNLLQTCTQPTRSLYAPIIYQKPLLGKKEYGYMFRGFLFFIRIPMYPRRSNKIFFKIFEDSCRVRFS